MIGVNGREGSRRRLEAAGRQPRAGDGRGRRRDTPVLSPAQRESEHRKTWERRLKRLPKPKRCESLCTHASRNARLSSPPMATVVVTRCNGGGCSLRYRAYRKMGGYISVCSWLAIGNMCRPVAQPQFGLLSSTCPDYAAGAERSAGRRSRGRARSEAQSVNQSISTYILCTMHSTYMAALDQAQRAHHPSRCNAQRPAPAAPSIPGPLPHRPGFCASADAEPIAAIAHHAARLTQRHTTCAMSGTRPLDVSFPILTSSGRDSSQT